MSDQKNLETQKSALVASWTEISPGLSILERLDPKVAAARKHVERAKKAGWIETGSPGLMIFSRDNF
jgi:hypothetical protein